MKRFFEIELGDSRAKVGPVASFDDLFVHGPLVKGLGRENFEVVHGKSGEFDSSELAAAFDPELQRLAELRLRQFIFFLFPYVHDLSGNVCLNMPGNASLSPLPC